MVQVYKILNAIDIVDKDKLFTLSEYTSTRGHPKKLYKERPRLNIRANSFSNRVVNVWNNLPEQVVMAPSLVLKHVQESTECILERTPQQVPPGMLRDEHHDQTTKLYSKCVHTSQMTFFNVDYVSKKKNESSSQEKSYCRIVQMIL